MPNTKIKLAEERRESYVKQRQRSAVTSPFDGTVLEIPRIDGGSVRKGDTLAIIEQRRDRRVTALLNQDEVMKVGLGDEALIYIPAVGETVKGRVVTIRQGPRASSGSKTSATILAMAGEDLPTVLAKIVIDFTEPHKLDDSERYRSGLPAIRCL